MMHGNKEYPDQREWPGLFGSAWGDHFEVSESERLAKLKRVEELRSAIRCRVAGGTNQCVRELPLHLTFESLAKLGDGAPSWDGVTSTFLKALPYEVIVKVHPIFVRALTDTEQLRDVLEDWGLLIAQGLEKDKSRQVMQYRLEGSSPSAVVRGFSYPSAAHPLFCASPHDHWVPAG